MPLAIGVRLPVDWAALGFPPAFEAGGVCLFEGPRGLCWDGRPPDLGVRTVTAPSEPFILDGWGVDHVVVMVGDLTSAIAAMQASGHDVRRTMVVRGRQTAFFRVGPVLEIIEGTGIDCPLLYGVALWSVEPLETVRERWKAGGCNVSQPRDAVQEGQQIMTVRGFGAGLAVMSPPQPATTSGS